MTTWAAVPAIIAIIVKLGMLPFFWKAILANRNVVLLFATLMLLSTLEIASLILAPDLGPFAYLIHVYYAGAALTALAIFLFSADAAGFMQPAFRMAVTVIMSLVALLCLVPGIVIDGAVVINGNVVHRAPASAYLLWPAGVGATLIFSLCILYQGWKNPESKNTNQRISLLMLISWVPAVFVFLMVLILQGVGFPINAVGLFSSAVVCFLAGLLFSERRMDVFRALSFIPRTEERALRNQIRQLDRRLREIAFSETEQDDNLYLELRQEMETCLLKLSLWASDGNKSLAARRLGVSRATFMRKVKDL